MTDPHEANHINGYDSLEPPGDDFFRTYFRYIGHTEAPKTYHRWAIISTVAALLGRQFYLPFGHSRIYPNMYVWLVGAPGARKGTALGPIKNLLYAIKYGKLSPQRLSPEMFLAQLQKMALPQNLSILEDLEIDSMPMQSPCEMFVVADEIADFIRGNTDFCKVLCNLWDNLPYYDHPKLHGKSVYVHEPTVNWTGGITPEDIMLSVPPEAVGQGLFSRVILVHSEPTGIKIRIPSSPSEEATNDMIALMKKVMTVKGEATITEAAGLQLDAIYDRFPGIDSSQFRHYNSRRFTHLLKLALVLAATDTTTVIGEDHILKANTILTSTEYRMPKALGEFGRAKHAGVAHAILECLKSNGKPVSVRDLWKLTVNDLNRHEDLLEILNNLKLAEKIQQVRFKEAGKDMVGFLPKYKSSSNWQEGLLWTGKDFLFPEEML